MEVQIFMFGITIIIKLWEEDMKLYDLICILSAMPEQHDLFINGRVIEEVQLNMTRETVNLTLRGQSENGKER